MRIGLLGCGLIMALALGPAPTCASAQERFDPFAEGIELSLQRYEAGVDYATPISDTCTETFEWSTPKPICRGTACIGQDLCEDGTLSIVREEDVVCDCGITCDWDDGSRRTTCGRCPGNRFYYEGANSDELCADHGGVKDSTWMVTSYMKDVGLYSGPASPPHSGYQPGPDEVRCGCLSDTYETGCLDSDGPTTATAPQICQDVCSAAKGTFARSAYARITLDSPNCVEAEGDRGPEVHCQCAGGPEVNTWCTDDPSVCTDRDCVVHHTAPSSTRCLPVPAGGGGEAIECELNFYIDECTTVGAVGFDAVYPEGGRVPGFGSEIECTAIPGGVLAAFNGLDEGFTAGLISLAGIPCPASLVSCRYVSNSPVTAGDFETTTTDIADPDGNPIADVSVQIDVACVLPTTTTSTTSTTTSTSTTTTVAVEAECPTYDECVDNPLHAALSWLFVAVGRADEAICVHPLVVD